MNKIIWKNEVKYVFLSVSIILLFEIIMSKGEYNFAELFFSVFWKILLISFIRIVFLSVRKQQPTPKK